MDWSENEVKLIVEDYFAMLKKELADQPYNKTEHRKKILPLLNNRNESSIEFKHRNITAILMEMGQPFIKGYKRLANYQQLLIEGITNYFENNQSTIEFEFEQFARQTGAINIDDKFEFQHFLSDEPVISNSNEPPPSFKPRKINYLEKEQNNRDLGQRGESLIVEYEKWTLIQAGKEKLANKVEWVSKVHGDGTGFDILSKDINGKDKFIEVKTTKLSKETPIYLTVNELRFAELKGDDFFLYRVFNFGPKAQFFYRNGIYSSFCTLSPQTYKGFFY